MTMEARVGTRAGRANLTVSQKEQIHCLRNARKLMHEIAKIMGVSIGAVWHTLNADRDKPALIPRKPQTQPRVTDPSLLRRLTAGR